MTLEKFELLGGNLSLDFVNTIHHYGGTDPQEDLLEFGDLIAFAKQSSAIGSRDAAELHAVAKNNRSLADRSLADARNFRLSLYRIFSAIASGKSPGRPDLDSLNAHLGSAYRNLRIENKNRRLEWSWNRKNQALDRVLWPVVRSAAELLTSEDRPKLHECESETCTWLFLDGSKNGTRRWCDMKRCGNRAKWHRHYEKNKPQRRRARKVEKNA